MRQDRRWGLSVSQKKELWERWKRGESSQDIARAFRKLRGSLYHVLASSGGIPPSPRRRSRWALRLSEREEISRGLAEGQSTRGIASSIQRAPSTVSREIGRHGGRAAYRAAEADGRAWDHARRPKPCRLAVHRRLQKLVAQKLSLNWSPEQISGWLKRRYPDTHRDARRAPVSVHDAREAPEQRQPEVARALTQQIRRLPVELRRSLTWDRGVEMAAHKEFSIATDVHVYFCDPQSPWQRGTNENTNGLLRQYFPKGTDLSVCSQADLNRTARQLNQRPRKTLAFRSPVAVLHENVALTG